MIEAMPDSILTLIRCPSTGEDLTRCPSAILEHANREQTAGRLFNQLGIQIAEPIDQALINQSESFLVVVDNHVPVLVQDDLVPIDHFDESEF
ncbi:hypothetical protein OAL05_00630 [bacterium]|jgi:hypothetical protein|nr:hypothetical protein [bacterium]